MVALKQGSVPDVIANKLDHLLILTSGTEQYLITCTNKKYKFLLTTTLTISACRSHKLSENVGGKNYNSPKSEDSRQPQCPLEKEKAIREAFKYFGMI